MGIRTPFNPLGTIFTANPLRGKTVLRYAASGYNDFMFDHIRLLPGHQNATIDLGDGTTYSCVGDGIFHTYPSDGIYTVSISDDVLSMYDWLDQTAKGWCEVLQWGDSLEDISRSFMNCGTMGGVIPPWGPSITNAERAFQSCPDMTGAWTTDPAMLMPSRITNHTNCVLACSDAVRSLFYPSWGGIRPEGT